MEVLIGQLDMDSNPRETDIAIEAYLFLWVESILAGLPRSRPTPRLAKPNKQVHLFLQLHHLEGRTDHLRYNKREDQWLGDCDEIDQGVEV